MKRCSHWQAWIDKHVFLSGSDVRLLTSPSCSVSRRSTPQRVSTAPFGAIFWTRASSYFSTKKFSTRKATVADCDVLSSNDGTDSFTACHRVLLRESPPPVCLARFCPRFGGQNWTILCTGFGHKRPRRRRARTWERVFLFSQAGINRITSAHSVLRRQAPRHGNTGSLCVDFGPHFRPYFGTKSAVRG